MKKTPRVKFKPMSTGDFEQWHALLGENYAVDLVKAGFVTETKAAERAESQLKQMLKDGLKTENHNFYIVHDADSEERVGRLWIMYEKIGTKKNCFIADIGKSKIICATKYGLIRYANPWSFCSSRR